MASCFGFIGFFVFFFFVSLSQAQSGESHFELYKLPAEYVRDSAVCNDGSPGAFYFSPSPSQPTRWIIHLQVFFILKKKKREYPEREHLKRE